MAYDPKEKRHNIDYKGHYKNPSPSRADHLERYKWKPGQSGNPSGRKKNVPSIVETLKKHLARHPEDIDKIVASLIKQGIIGNMVATKEMLDRVDGKVVERHKVEGDLPIKVIFVPAQKAMEQKEEPEEDKE